MDNEGLQVVLSVDNSQLVSGVNQAKQTLSQLGTTAQTSLKDVQSAATSAGEGLNQVAQGAQKFSEATGEAGGSARAMRESVTLLSGGLQGTASATEIARVAMMKFGASMGGPMLLGISLAVAALGFLVSGIMGAIEHEKELQTTANALQLPVDNIRSYTAAMIELQQKLADVKAGFTNLNEAQKNFGKATGVNMTNNPSIMDVMKPIVNSSSPESDKVIAVANAFGISLQDAAKKLQDFEDQLSKPVGAGAGESFWSKFATYNAIGQGMEIPTQGQQWGIKPGSGPALPSSALVPQNTLDNVEKLGNEVQNVTTKITELKNKATEANDSAITDPGQKIIAEATLKIQQLQQATDAAKRAIDQDHTPGLTDAMKDSQKSALDSSTATTSAAIMSDARQKARQADLKADQEYRDQLAALQKAGDTATSQESTDEAQREIDTATQRVAALKEQLDKDLENTALNAQQKLALQQAYETSAAALMQQANQKADQIRQQQADKSLNQLQSLVKVGTDYEQKAAESDDTNKAQKIIQQANAEIEKLQQMYDKLVRAIQDNPNLSDQQKSDQINAATADKNTSTQQIVDSANKMAANASPINQMFKQWQDTSTQWQNAFVQGMNSMSTSLTQFIMTGKMNFDSFAQSIISDIIKIMLQSEMAGIFGSGGLNLAGIFGGGGGAGGGVAASVTAGNTAGTVGYGFAGGGTVQAGVPTMVGERGAELFVPNTGGNIVNAANIGGSSPNFSVSVVNQSSTQVKAKNAKPTFTGQDAMIQIFLQDLNSGGPMSSGIGQAFGLNRSTLT